MGEIEISSNTVLLN